MRSRPALFATIIAAFATALGCARDGVADLPEMASGGVDIGVGPAAHVLEAGSDADTLSLSSPGSVITDGSTFLVSDVMNDRIVRLDTAFAYLGEFGASGAGPGELDVPLHLVMRGEDVFVGELANGRYSIFDRAGGFVRSIASTHTAGSFAVRADGRILAAAPGGAHYLVAVAGGGGEAQPLLARPPALALVDTGSMDALSSAVLIGPGDTTHVFDDRNGVLLKYDADGTLLLARRLPAEIVEREEQVRRELAADLGRQGHRLVGTPYLKSMSFTDDGAIVLLITRDDLVALVVDPGDYRYRRITAPLDDPDRFYLRTATDAIIRGERIFAFSANGLATYPLVASR